VPLTDTRPGIEATASAENWPFGLVTSIGQANVFTAVVRTVYECPLAARNRFSCSTNGSRAKWDDPDSVAVWYAHGGSTPYADS
jgi:hypothetical protein